MGDECHLGSELIESPNCLIGDRIQPHHSRSMSAIEVPANIDYNPKINQQYFKDKVEWWKLELKTKGFTHSFLILTVLNLAIS